MKLKRLSIFAAVAVVSATAIVAFADEQKRQISKNLDTFNSIYKTLLTTYVDTVDPKASIDAAIDAMLNEIDPYTVYIPEEQGEDFRTISTGEFGGIGAYIQQLPSGETMISEPQEGTPAANVGLKAGDVIITIDGDTVTKIGSDKVRERLRGQAGTELDVVVRRPYVADSIRKFHITRAKIEVQTVPYWGVLGDSIGYIALSTFNEKSAPEVRDAVKTLVANPKVKGIILDLRSNGGGLLESAVDIVGIFVPKGTEVVRTRGRSATNERIFKTTRQPVSTTIPLAVLIDETSASSSEITAGSLQDLDRAIIIGERSFGKGLVQSTRQLPYNGLLKVTTAKYYIPSGRLIQAIDYSHRNPDGSVARIPDSLTNVYQTRAGREVRDGGGITPDIKVEYPELAALTYRLYSDRWIFDFATRYAAEHDSIAAPVDFVVDDEMYAAFKQSIDPTKVQYDKLCETIIDQLEKAARREGYYNDSIAAKIEDLKTALKHDLDGDLDIHRRQISKYLASELLKRYYFDKGSAVNMLRDDDFVIKAAEVLSDPETYRATLSPK